MKPYCMAHTKFFQDGDRMFTNNELKIGLLFDTIKLNF